MGRVCNSDDPEILAISREDVVVHELLAAFAAEGDDEDGEGGTRSPEQGDQS